MIDRANTAKQSMQHAVTDLKAAGFDKIAFALESLIGKLDVEVERREVVRDHPRLF